MSKKESISNILNSEDIRIACLVETNLNGNKKPDNNSNFECFVINRSKDEATRCKGGVALAVDKSLSKNCIILEKDNKYIEYIMIQINKVFEKPLVVCGVYGLQTSHVSTEVRHTQWDCLLQKVKNESMKDKTVIILGDLNAWVGNNGGLKHNNPSTNIQGEVIHKFCTNNGFSILNKLYEGCQITHYDRSHENSNRCLDYIITYREDLCTRYVNDMSKRITPYRVIKSNVKDTRRKYCDQLSQLASLNISWNKSNKIEVLPPRIKRDEEGHIKYFLHTQDLAIKLGNLMQDPSKSVDQLFNHIVKGMETTDVLSYTRYKSKNIIKMKQVDDEAKYWKMVEDIKKKMKILETIRTSTNRVWAKRKRQILGDREEELFSIFNKDGDLVETKEEVMAAVSDYNKDLE